MTRRYFVPDLDHISASFALSSDEAQHATRVMRARVGDQITLFDGKGNEAVARIEVIDRRQCVVRAEPPQRIEREPTRSIELAIALPKPDRCKEMVERLTELGVARIIPIICERTQRPPSDSLLKKLRRVVVESCKQSKRNRLLEIDSAIPLKDYPGCDLADNRMIAHPNGSPIQEHVVSTEPNERVCCLIGPEGGFTDDEVQTAIRSGFAPVDLGKRILRIETAACLIACRFTD